jgi:hypothetical protein
MIHFSAHWMRMVNSLGPLVIGGFLFLGLSSCGQKADSGLIVKLIPKESLVLEFNAYTCLQIIEGIRTIDGFVAPAVTGPVVQFNRMSMQWTKDTKLYVHSAKIKFRGGGIKGGETICDLTNDLPFLFESTGANNSGKYEAGGFLKPETANSNPKCRVVCSLPLENEEQPEISATGELIVKASEVSNEGEESEKVFRVKSKFRVTIKP